MLPPIPMSMGPSGPVDGIQPLPSSVVNEQPSTIDAQFMQQQSQVFVFSTEMANKSAESVAKGIHKSIIQYHCAQPKTRKYLERNPLKMSQHNRQNSNQWMNNFDPMKSKNMAMGPQCNVDRSGFRNSPMLMQDALNSGPVGPPPGAMNMPPRLPMWNQQGNINPMNVNSNNQHGPMMSSMCNNSMIRGGPGPSPMSTPMNAVLPGPMGPNPSGMMHSGMPMKCQSQPSPMDMMSDAANSNPLNVLPPLGVKVPDENLTPEQRLMREDKMATLRRIGEMLLPENQQSPAHRPMNAEMPSSAHNPISVDDISSVLGGNDSSDMQLQKTGPNSGSSGGATGAAGGTGSCPGGSNGGGGPPGGGGPLADWQKMPPFFEDRKRVPEVGNRCSSARSQGPPPPYHQTTRSASVPIAVPSPNPNSPGNATSNLSLPSPRTCSGMNSPASKQGPGPSPNTNQLNSSIESPSGQSSHGGRGMNISNPGTPVSSGMHLSPNSKQKDGKMCTGQLPSEFSPAASGQQSPDSIFTRSLQNLARQQQHQKPQPQLPHTQPMQSANSHCKEPNLMPVPSPQHIQYLSTFEGQELTIQKQPNTSLKDTPSIVSPSLSSAGLESMIPVSTDSSCAKVSVSAPNTPLTPSSLDIASSKYPGTPGDFSALSPNSGGPDGKSQMRGGPSSSNQLKNDLRFPCNSPQLPDQSSQMQQQLQQPPQQQQPQQQQRFQPTTTSYMSQANKNTFLDVSSPDKLSCNLGVSEPKDPNSCSNPNFARIMPNNVPIDSTAVPKPPFDPISSLTQMSQQLTNSVPGSPASQVGMMHSGMMSYGGGGGGGGGHLPPNTMSMMPMNEMAMCGNPSNEPPPSSMADGSRMAFNSQMPPSMNMRLGGGGPVPNRMIQCPNPNDGGGGGGPGGGAPMGIPKPGGMPPGSYPMMAGNPQRMLRPSAQMQTAYNGANIQVKPNAPNTIQYLPNRPQSANIGARGPPSLEFLRFQNANAMSSNMDNKMQPPPPHGMNYFPNNYPGGPGNPMNDMMAANMNCGMPPGANPMARAPSMRGGVNPQGPPPPPPNMGRIGGGGGMPGNQMGMPPFSEQMYPPQGGGGGGPGPGPGGPNPNMPNNCHMFMGPNQGPPKMGGLGMGGNVTPDATQPLPPSMAQPNNFKNATFMNSSIPDIDNSHFQAGYQQFQQQLYATNTRNQVSSQPMSAPNEQYYGPK